MEFYYSLLSSSTSITMIGGLLSFAGVGLLILILSERIIHGLSKLLYFFGNQILIYRRDFSKKYIEENKGSNNQICLKQTISQKEVSLTEQKEWLEKILKIKV